MIKTKLSRGQVPFLLFTFFVTLVSIPVTVLSQPSDEVYVYSFPEYHRTEILFSYFNKSGWKVTSYDLNILNYSDEFFKMASMLAIEGVEVVPPEECT